jgi:OOP family OmpA-OmpF porin
MSSRAVLLLGVLALGVVGVVCVRLRAPHIEQDLLTRSAAALRESRIPSDGLRFSGRDALLTGVRGAGEVSDRARQLVASVPGVREVSVEYVSAPLKGAPDIHPAQAKLDAALIGRPVEFAEDRVQLTPRGRLALDGLIPILTMFPEVAVEIQGHAVSINGIVPGDPATNLALSKLRAEAVKTYLVSKGISPARLSAKGFGAAKPVASNLTPEGRRQNRRIEFVVKEGQ